MAQIIRSALLAVLALCLANTAMAMESRTGHGGGGGGAPSGAAGGVLSGTYPNPGLATSVALPGSPTTTTQSVGDNSTKVATTAFVLANGGGTIQSITIALTANQINHLFSVPVTLVPAPGAGKLINPLQATALFKANTLRFGKAGATIATGYGSCATIAPYDLAAFVIQAVSTVEVDQTAGAYSKPSAALDNQPLVACGLVSDFVSGGAVATSNLHAGGGGTGYAPGDTGGFNDCTALYTIDTVGGGGDVLTYHLTNTGYECPIISNEGTFTNDGTGDGNFTVDIATVNPGNGSGTITILYTIATLP